MGDGDCSLESDAADATDAAVAPSADWTDARELGGDHSAAALVALASRASASIKEDEEEEEEEEAAVAVVVVAGVAAFLGSTPREAAVVGGRTFPLPLSWAVGGKPSTGYMSTGGGSSLSSFMHSM